MTVKVMFVCSANTSRSVMAEAIFKSVVDENIEVYSSGVSANTGAPASINTLEVCKNHGLNVSEHLATNIDDSNIVEMDLILTATWAQKRILNYLYPQLKEVYTMKEFVNVYPFDIGDPFGLEIVAYEACFKDIYSTLEKIHEKIINS